jgi:putative transposase
MQSYSCFIDVISLIGKNLVALSFITWRLYGSIPASKRALILKEKDISKRFLLFDNELDRASYGPTWLKNPALAQIVVDACWYGETELDRYRLSAFVVMSNHVHILIWPKARLARITKSIKGYTARECNKLLERTGEKFWQEESFDHAVRNEEQFYRIKRYIERSPVKAGLVNDAKKWPWSSAWNE